MANKKQADHGHDHIHDQAHGHSIMSELMCHFPYAIFSVAASLSILSFLVYMTMGVTDPALIRTNADTLFHSFHFIHIVFAATGVLISFFRFSKNIVKGILVGIVTTITFCSLSDAVIPYLAGRLLGVDMHFHLCFLTELHNILPFLIIGLANGVVMGLYHRSRSGFYSVFSHFFHILISSFASTFYIVSHGLLDWYSVIGMIFLFLIIAVVIPCTLSDVVIPMAAARIGKK